MRRFAPVMAALALLPAVCGQGCTSSDLPTPGSQLASNTVIARYTGTTHVPCRFMTADCPDRCDHATDVANFLVEKNEKYTRNSSYGDAKALPGTTLSVDARKAVTGQDDAAVHKFLSGLKPGQRVRMTVSHLYVEHDGVQEPARPVTEIQLCPGE